LLLALAFNAGKCGKILYVGGYTVEPFELLSTVEIIDLDQPAASCPQVANFPFQVDRLTAAFVDGSVLACGGLGIEIPFNACYQLDQDLQGWAEISPLPYGRNHDLQSSVIKGQWVITGGQEHYYDTLIYGDERVFIPGPDLLARKEDHCQLTVGDDHIFVTGGYESDTTYMMDWSKQAWNASNPIPNFDMAGAACGLANDDVVVVAKEEFTFLFSLADQSWSAGPPLPRSLRGLSSVQVGETFVAIGGWSAETEEVYDGIYKFDSENEDWELLDASLGIPKASGAAVALPEGFVQCS